MNTMTACTWTCWYRRDRRHPWQRVAAADNQAAAWRAVLAYPLSGDKTVCAPGRDPNKEPGRGEAGLAAGPGQPMG
jgi:hypothetical protein